MKTLLIAGFGDIAQRALPRLLREFAVLALVRPQSASRIVSRPGLMVEPGDLDEPRTLARFAGRASHVLHCAPPPSTGTTDPRTANLLAMLDSPPSPRRIVYIGTSGVYGDCAGEWVDEKRRVNPATDRGRRRADAERQLESFARTHGTRCVLLRAPGIYAADRLPLDRLRRRIPVLREDDDVYTNHIHADDLASIAVAALIRAEAEGIYNACDDTQLRMGEWFDLLADRAAMPRPPRIARAQASGRIPAASLSFMSESRRLSNRRMKEELGVQLRYPTVFDGLPATLGAAAPSG